MRIWESCRMAWRALGANKVRSSLTMLGIIIGVGAVIALLSIGRGAERAIASEIEGLGTNLLLVQPGRVAQSGVLSAAGSAQTLTLDDARAIADPARAPSVARVAPDLTRSAQVLARGRNANLRIVGVTEEYQVVRNVSVAVGRFVSASHVEEQAAVAVMGAQAAADLFGAEDPIGQSIFINRVPFQVIGVLEAKGPGFVSPDELVYVPLSTAHSRLFGSAFYRGSRTVSSINVEAAGPAQVEAAIAEIGAVLRQQHRLTGDDDFVITSQQEYLDIVGQVTGIMTLFLGSIAAISLVVGGIGIMNIMLVSVTERTREIGIRKAVGARRRDILVQFLIESVLLSVAGGVIGVGLGGSVSRIVSGIDLGGGKLPATMQADVVLLAVLFSASVGLFFGVYPAWRAARLNPIEALRTE